MTMRDGVCARAVSHTGVTASPVPAATPCMNRLREASSVRAASKSAPSPAHASSFNQTILRRSGVWTMAADGTFGRLTA